MYVDYLTDFETVDVEACQCQDLFQTLVINGLFPTSPSQPRVAVSIDLLNLYIALFERSCDAINALASALKSFYTGWGFIHNNAKVWRSFVLVTALLTTHRGKLFKMRFARDSVMQCNGMTASSVNSQIEWKRLCNLQTGRFRGSKTLMGVNLRHWTTMNHQKEMKRSRTPQGVNPPVLS